MLVGEADLARNKQAVMYLGERQVEWQSWEFCGVPWLLET